MGKSQAELLRELPEHERLKRLANLTPAEQADLNYDWEFWARPEQLPPTCDYRHWLILAGRGWGKTRTGAEYIKERVRQGLSQRIALVAPTWGDFNKVMVGGESGLLNLYPDSERPEFNSTKGEITWRPGKWSPDGAVAYLYSSETPSRLRGPQHDTYWADELCAWTDMETWIQLQMTLRLKPPKGGQPCGIITTTPRPIPILKTLVRDPACVVTKGTTFDNSANMSAEFLQAMRNHYENTRLGRQELNGEILDDNPGAMWKRKDIEDARVRIEGNVRDMLLEVVVAIDPAVTNRPGASDETGILVVGVARDKQAYVLEDLSGTYSPDEWGRVALAAYRKWNATALVAEVNQGGDLVKTNLEVAKRALGMSWFRYEPVRATKGKAIRAEPVAALYEQLRVHHVGYFPKLEDQMCEWNPQDPNTDSPDRMDALVWALTFLIISKPAVVTVHRSLDFGMF